MSLKDSRQKAQEQFDVFCNSRELKDFRQVIQITHEDGSVFILRYASLWKSDGVYELEGAQDPKWLGVSTEHNGNFLFFAGGLSSWHVSNM